MATTLASISIKDNSTWNTYLNLIYPIGSVYISYTSTSPATRFGGTWAAHSGTPVTGGIAKTSSKAFSNMPAYQTLYAWRRTA